MIEWFASVAEDFPHTWRPLTAALLVILGAGFGRLLGTLLTAYARRVARRLGIPLARVQTRPLGRNAFGMLLAWSAHEAFQVLEIPGRAARVATGAAFALGIVFGVLLARHLLTLSLGWYAAEVAKRTSHPVDTQFIPLLRRLANVFIVTTGAVIALKGYGYDISTLVVSLGVGSLAIGLAMQQTLANMIAGFTIMLDRPFRVGDRVQLSTGEIGDVVDIGLRSTRIVNFDLSTLIIPNSQMVNDRIVNHTFPDRRERPLMRLAVAYGTDLEQAKRVVSEILAAEPLVSKEPAPAVLFTGYGESAMNLAVRFNVRDYHDTADAVDAVGRAITKRFGQEGIVIPYPVRTIILQPAGGAPSGPDTAVRRAGAA